MEVIILSVDATPVKPSPEPWKLVAVIIPVVLILTVVPIPTDVWFPSLSANSISPCESCLIVIVVAAPIIISSTPLICLWSGSRVIDPVPIVKIPVILVSPTTYKEYPDCAVSVAIPTALLVLIPTESTAQVPAAPVAPNFKLEIPVHPVPIPE